MIDTTINPLLVLEHALEYLGTSRVFSFNDSTAFAILSDAHYQIVMESKQGH